MKRIAVFIIAFTCLVGAAEFGHAATATNNLTVSASVVASCSIATTPISFPAISIPQSPVSAGGAVTVDCAAGQAWTITLSRGGAPAGAGRGMFFTGVRMINYDLFKDAGNTQIWGDSGFAGTYPAGSGVAGVGTGAAQQLIVFGQAQSTTTTPAGNYTDIVVATVNF